MHYYKFNIADWVLHTAHLSLLEEAIYFRLINFYYESEKPIPLDTRPVIRRLRLIDSTGDFENILGEFFEETENGFVHKRCEEVLKEYRKTIKKNRTNGSKGGRPKKIKGSEETQEKPSGLYVGTQAKPKHKPNQEPITIEPITTNQSEKIVTSEADALRNGVPYKKIIDLYHEKCPMLPKVSVLTSKRKTAIRSRWNEELLGDIDAWGNYFDYVSNTPFLCGQNDRGWRADIDFLTKPETAVKCQEGKYSEIQ